MKTEMLFGLMLALAPIWGLVLTDCAGPLYDVAEEMGENRETAKAQMDGLARGRLESAEDD